MPNHISIKPIKCEIDKGFLYNLEEHNGEWIKAKIIGLTSYPGNSLTLHVVVEESGAIFSYMPLHSVRHKESDYPQYNYHVLDYEFCHDPNMVAVEFEHLTYSSLRAFVKDGMGTLHEYGAEYICTLDWPDDNYLQHFVKLSNGQFAAIPNHKLLVNSEDSLPDYKKLRYRWD